MTLSVGLALMIASFAALAVTIVLGLILVYHWFRYAASPFMTLISILAYCCVSASLLFVLFGVAISYTV